MYVVVTRARMRQSQRMITHVWGPFLKQSKAKSVKSNIKKQYPGEEIEVSVCHVLDPENEGDSWDAESIRTAMARREVPAKDQQPGPSGMGRSSGGVSPGSGAESVLETHDGAEGSGAFE